MGLIEVWSNTIYINRCTHIDSLRQPFCEPTSLRGSRAPQREDLYASGVTASDVDPLVKRRNMLEKRARYVLLYLACPKSRLQKVQVLNMLNNAHIFLLSV